MAVIVAGIVAGKFFAAPKNSFFKPTEETTLPIDLNFESLEKADYIAVMPSSGILIFTQGLDVSFDEENDIATGYLEESKAALLQNNMEVVLYDLEGVTLPIGGYVSAINKEDGKFKVFIKLPDDTDESFLMPFVNIITNTPDVPQRLPLSALQKEGNSGQEYVWVTRKTDKKGKFRVEKIYIESGLANEQYFNVSRNLNEGEFVVVDPDKNFKPDREYNIAMADLGAPASHPIRQAWVDYEMNRLEELRIELEQIYADCVNGIKVAYKGAITFPNGKQTMVGCDTFQSPDDAKNIIESILRSGQNTSCGNCASENGASCGAAQAAACGANQN